MRITFIDKVNVMYGNGLIMVILSEIKFRNILIYEALDRYFEDDDSSICSFMIVYTYLLIKYLPMAISTL